jgi:hypothetical protein
MAKRRLPKRNCRREIAEEKLPKRRLAKRRSPKRKLAAVVPKITTENSQNISISD